jgi:hypothetical protein
MKERKKKMRIEKKISKKKKKNKRKGSIAKETYGGTATIAIIHVAIVAFFVR